MIKKWLLLLATISFIAVGSYSATPHPQYTHFIKGKDNIATTEKQFVSIVWPLCLKAYTNPNIFQELLPDWKIRFAHLKTVSASYDVNKDWSLSVNGKIVIRPYRTHEKSPLSPDVLSYRVVGTSVIMQYAITPILSTRFFAGSMFGGYLRIMDHYTNNPYRAQPYGGIDLSINF